MALATGVAPGAAAASSEASTTDSPVTGLPDSKGREFWLAFPANHNSTPDLKLFLTSEVDTEAQVEVPGVGFAEPVRISAGEVTAVQLPASVQLNNWDGVERKGVHVTAAHDITVYGLNRIPYTTDAFLGLPVDILGTEYYSLSYDRYWSQFAVVATVDDTVLRVTPASSTGGRAAGQTYEVVLDEGQTYQLTEQSSIQDLSGSRLEASAPIAAFGSVRCANVPREYAYCDHLVEQLFPTETWGQQFMTVPLATRSGGDTMRILAAEDDTVVRLNGSVVATLNAGSFHEQIVQGAAEITADKPVLVAQYSNGGNYDGQVSDPFMMLVPPHEQYLDSYTITTPATGFRTNYVNLVVPSANAESIVVDGNSVPANAFSPIGTSGFSGAQIPIDLGSHRLTSSVPFGLFVYGFDDYDSYGYPGGLSLSSVARVATVTVELGVDPVGEVGTDDCLQVLVSDRDGVGVGGVRVDIDVTGANPQSGFDITDVAGVAEFCYIGDNAGLDSITARVGGVTDVAEKRWEERTGEYTRPDSWTFGFRDSSGYIGDPVNTATGNLVAEHVDLASPHPLVGLDLTRTYNSLDTQSGVLGIGWTSQLDVRIDAEDAGAVTYRFADGRVVTFLRRDDGSYSRVEEVHGELSRSADGTFRLRLDDGEERVFDTNGKIARRSFADTTAITYTRDASGRVTELNGTEDTTIRFEYDAAGLLTEAITNDGRTVRYEYERGALVRVVDPVGDAVVYTLDDDRRIISMIDGSGVVTSTVSYDDAGRVATQGAPGGTTLAFSYADRERTTRVSDVHDGSELIFVHDAQARVTKVRDPLGAYLHRSYDDSGNLVSATDRAGSKAQQSFDSRGNLLQLTEQDNSTTSYTYDEAGRITAMKAPTGAVTRYRYEGNQRLPVEVVDGNGHTSRFEVRDGLVVSATDPDGVTHSFSHDPKRRMVQSTDGLGRVTRYTHDALGNDTSVTLPSGAKTKRDFDAVGRLVREVDPFGAATTYDYDGAGRPKSVTDPTGAITRSDYDAVGRLISDTDQNGAITRYEYDELGRLVTTIAPGGATYREQYGPLSRVTASTDASGAVTRYTYDANGTQVAVRDALGGEIRETVDHRGRVTARTDELGRTTKYAYDAAGRLVTEVDPTGKAATFVYDPVGNLIKKADRTGATTRFDYSPGNRLRSESDPTDRTTRHAYDVAGQLVATTAPGGHTTSYGYDADGRQILETSPGGLQTIRRFDAAGREVETTSPGQGTTIRTYTPRGELAMETDATGARRNFRYDPAGRLVAATAANGATTTYDYDARGNRTARVAADGSAERWEYDLADRMIAAVDALGKRSTTEYDALGRVRRVVDASGRSRAHEYDAAGQLVKMVAADGATRSFAYDRRGWRTAATDATGTTTYAYDDEGRTLSRRLPDGRIIGYGYDLAGRRTSLTRPNGQVDQYDYDEAGRLASLASGGSTAAYHYDSDGRVIDEQLPGGTRRRYSYANGLLSGYQQDGGPYQAGSNIERDAAGRRSAETRAGARTSYRYDQAGQLIGWGRSSASYDSRGNRLTLARDGHTTHYDYDAAGQLTATRDRVDSTTYTYDAAGRRTATSDGATTTKFDYDSWGQAVAISTSRGGKTIRTAALAYDVDGQLSSVSDGRARTSLLWDNERDIPQPLEVDRPKGPVHLVHGDSRAYAIADGKTNVFHQDSSGSILRSGDITGLAVAQSYDPFGTPSGTDSHEGVLLGYRGELTVEGLVHLRARDYDPLVGAFLTRDPLDRIPGELTEPNAYTYSNNDPLNMIDPLGTSALDDRAVAYASEGARRMTGEEGPDRFGGVITANAHIARGVQGGGTVGGGMGGIGRGSSWNPNGGGAAGRPPQPGKVPRGYSPVYTEKQLNTHFMKHARDFGITGPNNAKNRAAWQRALQNHVRNYYTVRWGGSKAFRGGPGTIYYNSLTQRVVVTRNGQFLTGFKLNPAQEKAMLRTGRLGGG